MIAYGRQGDVALALSTSGSSPNIIEALAEARRRGLATIACVGYDGGRIAAERLADHVVVDAGRSTFRGSRRRRRARTTSCANSSDERRGGQVGLLLTRLAMRLTIQTAATVYTQPRRMSTT